MRADVVARRALDNAEVRLRLRQVIEADRTLHLNEPPVSERTLQRLRREQHRRPVRARLRLLHEQEPVEQFDRVVLVEKAVLDQAVVFMAGAAKGNPAGGPPLWAARIRPPPQGANPLHGAAAPPPPGD